VTQFHHQHQHHHHHHHTITITITITVTVTVTITVLGVRGQAVMVPSARQFVGLADCNTP
jgi:hypothetical protein